MINVNITIFNSYNNFLATPTFLFIISFATKELNVTLNDPKVSNSN